MTHTFKLSTVAAFAVITAHAAIGFTSASSLQHAADVAVMPIVKAEKIVVSGKALQIVKAEKITVTAKRADAAVALTSWNAAA